MPEEGREATHDDVLQPGVATEEENPLAALWEQRLQGVRKWQKTPLPARNGKLPDFSYSHERFVPPLRGKL